MRKPVVFLFLISLSYGAMTEAEIKLREKELELERKELELEKAKLQKNKNNKNQQNTADTSQQQVTYINPNQENSKDSYQGKKKNFYIEYGTLLNNKSQNEYEYSGSYTNRTSKGDEFTTKGYLARIGFGEFEKNRHEIVYGSLKGDKDDDPATSLWYNYIITIERWKDNQFLPYADLGIGVGSVPLKGEVKEQLGADKQKFISTGYGFGCYLKVNESLQFKIGYRREVYVWEKIEVIDGLVSYDIQRTTTNKGLNAAVVLRF
ncbi:MAG: hypothetical protein OIF32_10155 [Campylobacterales bacterium]|nr:hypothetical protein [Campylobacterales bacterium]